MPDAIDLNVELTERSQAIALTPTSSLTWRFASLLSQWERMEVRAGGV